MKKSKIEIEIGLDENQVPEQINWEASDAAEKSEVKALLMSVWDKKEEAAMRIDLWTKEMTVDEMKMFYYQSLMTLADTFERATSETDIASNMKEFAQWFAEELELKIGS